MRHLQSRSADDSIYRAIVAFDFVLMLLVCGLPLCLTFIVGRYGGDELIVTDRNACFVSPTRAGENPSENGRLWRQKLFKARRRLLRLMTQPNT
jgi:hypothetical protein